MSQISLAKPPHLTPLDGLRGLAAMGVLIFHLRIVFSVTGNPLQGVPGMEWLQLQGFYLVDLFFVISGYVFAYVYLEQGRLRQGVSLGGFAWARFTRLWPLYIATLAFAAFILRDNPETTAANILISAALLHLMLPDNILNSPSWSISVECLCYLIFVLAAARGRRAFVGIAAGAMVLGIIMILNGVAPQIGRGLIGFFAGVFLSKHSNRLSMLPTLSLVACACVPYFLRSDGASIIAITLIGWTASVLLSLRISLLQSRLMKWIGDRSYAIYMCHVPIFIMTANTALVYGLQGKPWALGLAAMSTAMIVGIAHILFEKLERPAQNYLRQMRWPHRDGTMVEAGAGAGAGAE